MRKLFGLLAAALLPLMGHADEMPRNDYPRPQFQRSEWKCLNGQWTFCFDESKNGTWKNYAASEGFDGNITVPFCPESKLSGVGHTDFIEAMWYQRKVDIPAEWNGKKIMLHFGGVDYRATIFVNGKQALDHTGGSASFAVDIAPFVKAGEKANIVVYVQDDTRSRMQPGGKQSDRLESYACSYTRTTGIWQTVWLEPVAKSALERCRITPDVDNSQFVFEPKFYALDNAERITITVNDGKKEVARVSGRASNSATLIARIPKAKLWSPGNPNLYDVTLTVTDAKGNVVDRVKSYAGMRKVELRGGKFYINNAPCYLRLVLDQGFYPDGIWTAPSDEALKHDIELAMACGFNGARLHQKVFEQRYLYWADKMGYLVWGESPSWGMDWTSPAAARNLISEWSAYIERDYNAPSIIAWSPLNETWQDDRDGQRARLTNDLYFETSRLDRTRPVVTASGGYHAGYTDVYAEHNYNHDPIAFYNQLVGGESGKPYVQHPKHSYPYHGEAYIIDEYGGFGWFSPKDNTPSWGYGQVQTDIEKFYQELEDITDVLLSMDHICGYCYTQLTDVEQEKNGVYTYARETKFDMERIRRIFTKSREDAKAHVKEILQKAGK